VAVIDGLLEGPEWLIYDSSLVSLTLNTEDLLPKSFELFFLYLPGASYNDHPSNPVSFSDRERKTSLRMAY
jgi:hypothetical protein